MRQRRLKGLDEKLDIYSGGITTEPELQKGRWNALFDEEQPIYMELGCGKGQFILALAKAYPERNFIAIEANESVVLRALQKAARNVAGISSKDILDENGYEKPFEDLIEDGIFAVTERRDIKEILADGMEKNAAGVEAGRNAVDVEAGRNAADGSEKDLTQGGKADIAARNERRAEARAKAMAEFVPGYHIVDGKKKKNRRPDEPGNIYKLMPNLLLANTLVKDITDIFDEGELSGIYLNFSDPWPKARHAKRRLTHTGYLRGYRHILKPEGCLEFKTDNEGLFRFSIEEFDANNLERLEYTEDLHGVLGDAKKGRALSADSSAMPDEESGADSNGRLSAAQDAESGIEKSRFEPAKHEFESTKDKYESAKYMTEYEQKFTLQGKPIYYCKVKFA